MTSASERTVQVTMRIDADVAGRLDVVAKKLSRPGLAVGRTDTIRMAILAGLPRIEQDEGIKPAPGGKVRKRR